MNADVTHMNDVGVGAARAVVAYWDSLWEVSSDDERPTEDFAAEMDRRICALRNALEEARPE